MRERAGNPGALLESGKTGSVHLPQRIHRLVATDQQQKSASGDRSDLLGSLKIDRSAPAPAVGGRPIKWFVLLAVVAGVAFVGWFSPLSPLVDSRSEGLSIRTAVARAAVAENAGSVLDATGYVVARRQATVSAKTTGKVIDVLIEEGDRVEKGQMLAVLDDSGPRAQLALADSRLQSARAGLEELKVQLRQAELDLNRTQELAQRSLASQADLDRDGLIVEGLKARLEVAEREIVVAERGRAPVGGRPYQGDVPACAYRSA